MKVCGYVDVRGVCVCVCVGLCTLIVPYTFACYTYNCLGQLYVLVYMYTGVSIRTVCVCVKVCEVCVRCVCVCEVMFEGGCVKVCVKELK